MSTMTFATVFTEPRRPRPDAEPDPSQAQRDRHIRVIGLKVAGHWTVAQLAALEGVTPQTIHAWQHAVLERYDEPDAETIRRVLASRKRSAPSHSDDA